MTIFFKCSHKNLWMNLNKKDPFKIASFTCKDCGAQIDETNVEDYE